ncbi:hypothetical protein ACWEO6_33795, partial [Streptomyces sp. NPDC004291]
MHYNITRTSWSDYDPNAAWSELEQLISQMDELSNAHGQLVDRGEETYKDAERFADRMEELREQHDLIEAKLTVWLLGGGRRPDQMPIPETV